MCLLKLFASIGAQDRTSHTCKVRASTTIGRFLCLQRGILRILADVCEEFRRRERLDDFLAGIEFEIESRGALGGKAHLESTSQYANVRGTVRINQ